MKGNKFVVSRFATLTWSGGKGMLVSPVHGPLPGAGRRQSISCSADSGSLSPCHRSPAGARSGRNPDRGRATRPERRPRGARCARTLGAARPQFPYPEPPTTQDRVSTSREAGARAAFHPARESKTDSSSSTRRGGNRFFPPVLGRSLKRGRRRASSARRLVAPLLGRLLFLAARSKRVSRDKTLGDVDHAATRAAGAAIRSKSPCGSSESVYRPTAGIYHYRPKEHALERTANFGAAAKEFVRAPRVPRLRSRRNGAGCFWQSRRASARTTWKYDSIAYSVILKEVGCLLQTLYLAATALGLGACALGAGPLDLLARVTGVDALVEPQVGRS